MSGKLALSTFVAAGVLAIMAIPCGQLGMVEAACCYFAAKDKDILQPAQKAFITWDPVENVETFTVQPRFEGNAADFGMVIPTPSQPKLHEMPRDFFKELAVFTILEPMDLKKYKPLRPRSLAARSGAVPERMRRTVRVLEAGVVGSLEFKVIQADQAEDLYTWLKDHKYTYSGDEATLDFYIRKKWFFSVMRVDPLQLKKRPDGTYTGEITPTRFTFASERLVYPLRITQISVRDKTEALFYVQAPQKMDLGGDFSFQFTWGPMWSQAMSFAIPSALTKEEVAWQEVVKPKLQDYRQKIVDQRRMRREPASLEWAKKITAEDVLVLEGRKAYNRQAPKADIDNLKLLRGHVKEGKFITKIRKIFTKSEMESDLEFLPARIDGQDDQIEYFSILPTSPP